MAQINRNQHIMMSDLEGKLVSILYNNFVKWNDTVLHSIIQTIVFLEFDAFLDLKSFPGELQLTFLCLV